MNIIFSILVLIGIFAFNFAEAAESLNQKIFHVRKISRIEDGSLGFQRLYYTLACNESSVQLLTESPASHEINVGLLVQESSRPCDNPDREHFTRFLPGRNELRPVAHFDEVWYCSALCYQQNAPGYPPTSHWVDAYGTSERQAFNNMSCGGWISGDRCEIVPIAN